MLTAGLILVTSALLGRKLRLQRRSASSTVSLDSCSADGQNAAKPPDHVRAQQDWDRPISGEFDLDSG